MSTPEGYIVNAVLEFLAAVGIYAWRNNTGAVCLKNPNGRERFVRYGKPGSSDILGILPDGRMLAIECKTKTGRLSDKQRDFIEDIRSRHGVAFIARSVEDVELALADARDAATKGRNQI